MSGVSKTTLRLGDWKGLTELRKTVLMVMLYYSERIQLKIDKWERCFGQSPGEIRHQLLGVPSQGHGMEDALNSPCTDI